MNQTEIRYEHTRASDQPLVIPVQTEHCETRPLLAVLWMVIAFIVGTFVFEMAATGADPVRQLNEETPASIRLGDALYADETSVALATSRLESLFRIDQNEKLKPAIENIIETETMWLAMRKTMHVIDLASHDGAVKGRADTDPFVATIPVTIGTQQHFAPVVDLHVDVFEPTKFRQQVNASGHAKTTGNVAQAAQHEEQTEPTEIDSTPVSVSHLDMPVINPHETDLAKATIIRAQPISLSKVSSESTEQAPTGNATKELALSDSAPTRPAVQTARTHTASSDRELNSLRSPEAAVSVPTLALEDTPQTHLAAVDVARAAQTAVAAVSPPAIVSLPANAPQSVTVPVIVAPSQRAADVDAANRGNLQLALESSQTIRQPEERIAAAWPFTQAATANQPTVSLNVDNADVRTVFEMLARGYGINILVAPDVEGTVTANVEGLTPQQTLHGVMKMCNLRSQVEGNLVYVYSAEKMPADATELRMFPLDFARAAVLEPIVQGLLSPIGNAYASAMDDQDNMKNREAIVVVDTPESIARIESYIHQADSAPRQVMIEARVLEVELKDDLMHGVDLRGILGGDLTVGSDFLADPISSTSNPLFYAQISGSRVDALIDLVETTTDAKTLASPRVMVINGQQAKIQVGQQLGFAVATVTQTSTIQDVQFLDTGVVLSVKPTISRNNQILMDIKPEVSNGQINPDTLLPEEDTRELETSVMLNDHQGIVIGGLIQESDRTVIRKLPWLGDVKHVGKLFQRRETTRARSEIIIALVAHIVNIDEQVPQFCDHEQDVIQYQRTQTPLFEGTLQRACRPWEPRMPDMVGAEKHMDVNKLNRKIP